MVEVFGGTRSANLCKTMRPYQHTPPQATGYVCAPLNAADYIDSTLQAAGDMTRSDLHSLPAATFSIDSSRNLKKNKGSTTVLTYWHNSPLWNHPKLDRPQRKRAKTGGKGSQNRDSATSGGSTQNQEMGQL